MMSDARSLCVIAFPGAPNLPVFAALEHGYFEAEELDVELELTPSSIVQAQKVAAGEFQMAFTAFDNVVAYNEGQGAAGPDVDPEYVAVMGATQLELSLVVNPEVRSFADLCGRSIALDALTTGFAFVLFDMLERNGIGRDEVTFAAVGATPKRWHSVRDGEHAATLTIEPFTSLSVAAGFSVLERSTQLYDSYQGGVIAAKRDIAAKDPKKVRSFLRGYLRGLDWAMEPGNKDAAKTLLQTRMPEIKPQAIEAVMESLLSPRSGLTPAGAMLPEGVKTVLDLRSRFGSGGVLGEPSRYIDLSHYHAVTGAITGKV